MACRKDTDIITPVAGRFMTANGSNLKVLGKTTVRFRIAGLDVMHTVIVAKNLAQHTILGNDFLTENQCDLLLRIRQLCTPVGRTPIRFETKLIRINSVYFVADEQPVSKFTQFAVLAEDAVVQASSQQFVPCRFINVNSVRNGALADARQVNYLDDARTELPGTSQNGVALAQIDSGGHHDAIALEPNVLFETNYNLLVTPSVHSGAPIIHVNLTNWMPSSITVPKGTRVGKVYTIKQECAPTRTAPDMDKRSEHTDQVHCTESLAPNVMRHSQDARICNEPNQPCHVRVINRGHFVSPSHSSATARSALRARGITASVQS